MSLLLGLKRVGYRAKIGEMREAHTNRLILLQWERLVTCFFIECFLNSRNHQRDALTLWEIDRP